jgi:hypothetical protein
MKTLRVMFLPTAVTEGARAAHFPRGMPPITVGESLPIDYIRRRRHGARPLTAGGLAFAIAKPVDESHPDAGKTIF